jgi:branched-chain amino acid transport system permease protein
MEMAVEDILAQIVSGLTRGSILFLISAGLSLVFGVLSVLNVAHVSFYMLGAYLTYTFWALFQTYDFSYWLAIPLTCLAMAAIGFLVELVLMRHLYNRIQAEMLLVTFALIYVFSDLVRIIWGVDSYAVTTPAILSQYAGKIGAVSFPNSDAFTISMAVLLASVLWFWFARTDSGKLVRATQSEPEMVSALGKPVPLIYSIIFVISAVLAGLAGAVWMTTSFAQPYSLDLPMLPQVFIVMAIGGMGSLIGAFVASMLIGLVYAMSVLLVPRAVMVVIFVVAAVVLMIRPWGLFGAKGRLE